MFQRDVKEVAGAAGRVEHAHFAQLVVEDVHFFSGVVELAFRRQQQRGGLGVFPVFAQRFYDRRQHEAFDIRARGVVGTEPVALRRIKRAFQQGAENRRLDFLPIELRCFLEQRDLVAVERQHLRVLEQLAIKAQHVHAQCDREVACIHRPPHFSHQRDELAGVLLQAFEQIGECARRQ